MPLVLWLVATFGLVCAVTRSRAAAHPIPLPKPKPRAVREHVVVPSIHSREVACAQRSGVRHGEDALKVLDLGDDSVNVHAAQIWMHLRAETSCLLRWNASPRDEINRKASQPMTALVMLACHSSQASPPVRLGSCHDRRQPLVVLR